MVGARTAAYCPAGCAVIAHRADPVTSGLRLRSTKHHNARQYGCNQESQRRLLRLHEAASVRRIIYEKTGGLNEPTRA